MTPEYVKFSVKYRTVTITVYPFLRPDGQTYWQFRRSDGRYVTRAKKDKATSAAMIEAKTVFKGGLSIDDLTGDQIRGIKRMLDADPDLRYVDEFLLWYSRRAPKKRVGEAIAEFLAAKEANRGRSAQNVKTLTTRLSLLQPLHGENISDVAVKDLPEITGSPRTRKNIRASWITFFRWCAEMEFLPHGEKTAPERLEKPIARRKVPTTYTPKELEILLKAVSPKFLPFVVAGAFAGIRTDEMHPLPGGEKSPLDWSDFDWKKSIIRIRPETDKNGHGRIVPILPALRSWLWPIRAKSGPLISCLPSSGKTPETTRIGRLVGGWRPNALRHSYISYRASQIGLSKVALECGNSEGEARKSYHDAKSAADAKAWFGIVRVKDPTSPR